MITLTREEAQQVLDVLEEINKRSVGVNAICLPAEIDDAMETLRTRLAQPEPEPVAWTYQHEDTGLTMCVLTQQVEPGFEKNNPRWQKSTPLYTAPPQREWQSLTDEEIDETAWPYFIGNIMPSVKIIVRQLEAKLKEKNGG